MRWRGDWSDDVEYAVGDVVRSTDRSGLYIATGASRGREPAESMQDWQVLLSIDSLARGPCPIGMVRLPNQVCMDDTRRLYVPDDGDFARFQPAFAMQLCHQVGARLCGFDELQMRAICLDDPASCSVDPKWQSIFGAPNTWCDPLVYLPPSSFLQHADHGSIGQHFAQDLGGYVTVEVSLQGPPLRIDLRSFTRAACAQRWALEEGAAYLCCQDP